MTEIQGKSILVRVSARFELARVRVTGSRLYHVFLTVAHRAAVMISSKYGCASPEQNGGETPRNLLSSDDERVPVELIRVAFIKKSVLRSLISELLFQNQTPNQHPWLIY